MRTRATNPFRFPSQWPVLAALLSFCLVGTCVAQEKNESVGDSDPPFAGDADDVFPQEKAAQSAEATQRRNQELLLQKQREQEASKQHARAEDEYRKAMSDHEKVIKQNPQLFEQRAMLEQQLKELEAKRAELAQHMAQIQAAEMAARRQEQQQNTPLPKEGNFKVFSLRHSRAPEAARVLSEVLGGAATRLAVDERTNSLLVFADNETLKIVEALLMKLDERSDYSAIEKSRPGETLQLRIVWLLDIDEGVDPNNKLVSPEVVEALHELGFENPKVVCQQVTTLTLSDDDGRRGQFHFAVPVLIKALPWQFEGQGQIEPMAGKRFNVKFDLRFQQRSITDGERMGQEGQLGGSIYTPFGHYTVMGTTTFVAVVPTEETLKQQQHLSAFVVYLDRAREYPATESPSSNRTDVRR